MRFARKGQAARACSLLGQAENTRRYTLQCRHFSLDDCPPRITLAGAYQALTRAEMAAGQREAMSGYLEQARLLTESMRDPEARQTLVKDLESIRL